jgi:predicted GNAT superfamily acetyltransferase
MPQQRMLKRRLILNPTLKSDGSRGHLLRLSGHASQVRSPNIDGFPQILRATTDAMSHAITQIQPIVSKATDADLDGILALQASNQIDRGGTLSASLSRSRVSAMMHEMPLIVARREERITGFLMTTTREMNADLPIVQAMFKAYLGAPDAYVYGPVCVDAEERGKRLARVMFEELRALEPGREGILFIRSDNEASLRAHIRMGMREVAGFQFSGFDFSVFSFIG